MGSLTSLGGSEAGDSVLDNEPVTAFWLVSCHVVGFTRRRVEGERVMRIVRGSVELVNELLSGPSSWRSAGPPLGVNRE